MNGTPIASATRSIPVMNMYAKGNRSNANFLASWYVTRAFAMSWKDRVRIGGAMHKTPVSMLSTTSCCNIWKTNSTRWFDWMIAVCVSTSSSSTPRTSKRCLDFDVPSLSCNESRHKALRMLRRRTVTCWNWSTLSGGAFETRQNAMTVLAVSNQHAESLCTYMAASVKRLSACAVRKAKTNERKVRNTCQTTSAGTSCRTNCKPMIWST
mmetsp:Transcript_17252/g.51428  ORF Transcript_17252/g.51428 Transcript_17252/m.51428 type:complete len:210 (-) Transcript_17252:82-711(-)